MIYTHHSSSIETHLDAILPLNKSDRLNKSYYHSVTDLSWWHSAWSLACKWSKRNNNNNRINQVENFVFDWWKHIGWRHIDQVINTSTLSTSSSHQHHWVIKTSTHMINTSGSSTDWGIWQIYHWLVVHWIWNSMYSWPGIWEFVSFYCLNCEKSHTTCLF